MSTFEFKPIPIAEAVQIIKNQLRPYITEITVTRKEVVFPIEPIKPWTDPVFSKTGKPLHGCVERNVRRMLARKRHDGKQYEQIALMAPQVMKALIRRANQKAVEVFNEGFGEL